MINLLDLYFLYVFILYLLDRLLIFILANIITKKK
jgi:hypothetical protein